MVVTGAPAATRDAAPEVIWHDLECGGYRADLALWRELAAGTEPGSPAAPVLEIGAGSGRVSLELARARHRVTALDVDSRLLEALCARGAGLDVETVCADARTFDLGRRDYGLCLAPMQAVQLLGGRKGRLAFMRRARAHLRPGGVLACSIVSEFECFDCTHGEEGPAPEVVRLGRADYVSRPIRVSARGRKVAIERERWIVPVEGDGPRRVSRRAAMGAGERDVIELDLVSVEQLEREGLAAGLRPGAARRVEATDEHLASEVVILHA
jgi:SAM-dependent methyltransferase